MAPINVSKVERERKIEEVQSPAFAAQLLGRLDQSSTDSSLQSELQRFIGIIASLHLPPNSPALEEFDVQGTRLWNYATADSREGVADPDLGILVYVRVFAFFLIECAFQSSKTKFDGFVRVLKVALKCARKCLENHKLGLCLRTLEKAAQVPRPLFHATSLRKAHLPKTDQTSPKLEADLEKLALNDESAEHAPLSTRLSLSYFTIRTALSWRQSRLDIAEHMFTKAQARLEQVVRFPQAIEELADLLYEMGNDMMGKGQLELAQVWLARAAAVVDSQDLEAMSSSVGELRLCILHGCTKAALRLNTPVSLQKAGDQLALLENDYGEKLVVMLLRLEFLNLNRDFDARMYAEDKDTWIEKAITTRLWISLSQGQDDKDSANAVESVKIWVSRLSKDLTKPLSAAATHAAQVVSEAHHPIEAPKLNG
ncbi:MAG: hypothetical protein M1814_002171 [Vezdaea aestivalis]|nr:MAG: hypothetical protein M1814_002171 [Vezdaea aestivalis]